MSAKGRVFLKREEGEVLRAYRDPAGVWTIGVGLTAASGVVTPKAGMEITRERSDTLLARALRKYEARAGAAMPRAAQHEFDAGVSFDFNTGGIHRASWVKAWKAGNWAATRAALSKWVKGGGRVLPGLQRRREAEFALLRDADYGRVGTATRPGRARIALPMTEGEIAALVRALASLGYGDAEPATHPTSVAVRGFQHDHGLIVDGIVGRATLSTVERMLAARRKAGQAAAAGAAGGAESATGTVAGAAGGADWVGWAMLVIAGLWAAWLIWTYRDAVAARLQRRLPGAAAILRRF
ncbi:glycoside hydrolase family protein [Maritimibacter sp. 55A14]|uniref:glycoside hydrolase family protein n=1 Tax=Maritimibacter sp. 55A14 TaxID=2174844 RepID=UPI001304AB3F|nr:glycoside hydrolase family protein [Maritimibacter sp. 55A14]